MLDMPLEEFMALWTVGTWPQRATGAFPSLEKSLEHICQRLTGRAILAEPIKQACRVWLDRTRETLTPREKTLDILQILRQSGYKLGMMTDCSYETPYHWPGTPLSLAIDRAIFSCLVGMKKPDPRMYQLICQELAIQPEQCIYIGDGCGHELTGAAAAGMYPVLLLAPCDASSDSLRPDVEEWPGPRLSSFEDVLPFIENMNGTLLQSGRVRTGVFQ
ncbi:MAG: HAD-IA family hydrolase [Ktedonobacteraceae bacterium]|nr:HAD-IA family hydrolase [Ktedonobacteraceae bacterium]